MKRLLFCAASLCAAPLHGQAKRPFQPSDVTRLAQIADETLSPDGAWVAYTVTTSDTLRDQPSSDLWMVSWDGTQRVQLTRTPTEASHPAWSPDGRYLAFLSARDDAEKHEQVWLLDRRGGEPRKLTAMPGGVQEFSWAPDGRRLALIAMDSSAAPAKDAHGDVRPPRPRVTRRYVFRKDGEGLLPPERHHLYLFDLATQRATLLLPGDNDESLPTWSPDGMRIAFVARRGVEADRTLNYDVFVVDAAAGAVPRAVSLPRMVDASPDWGGAPAWSADGRSLAFVSAGPDSLIYYATQHLVTVPADGSSAPATLTAKLDRNIDHPQWQRGTDALLALVTDDGAVRLSMFSASGAETPVVRCDCVIVGFAQGPEGKLVVRLERDTTPGELYAVESGGRLRALTAHNAALLAEVELAASERIAARSRDGADVHGFLARPLHASAGPLPTVLRIHGGPVSQFQFDFDPEWQVLAGAGFAVIGGNPRGSSGRGLAWSSAIFADWGRKDAEDLLALVDAMVRRGVADSARLGVGGWSYGGILTDYLLVQDTRFKAATSGASIANIFAGYGTDHYAVEYDFELGAPFERPELWTRLSRGFLQAGRIVTPTLYLGGELDDNVPLIHSEQMYQVLRRRKIPTELVVYPGQYHGLTVPSYLQDRLERYLAWYRRFLH